MSVLGIDNGTLYAYASIPRNMEADPIPVVPGECIARGIPVDAYVEPPAGNQIHVYPAYRGKKNHACVVTSVKQKLKNSLVLPSDVISGAVTPLDVYAAQVRDVVRASRQEAVKCGYQGSNKIVFTYPAVYEAEPELLNQMENALNAIALEDGVHVQVVGRIPEPAAAGIDYLHHMQYIKKEAIPDAGMNILVVDLGHGTLDLAVLTISKDADAYQVHLLGGDPRLGGQNFDETIKLELKRQLAANHGLQKETPRIREFLDREARRAKEELTTVEEVSVVLNTEEDVIELTVTRAQFEELASPLMERFLDHVDTIMGEAKAMNLSIDRILVTGSASQMPMVGTQLLQLAKDIPVIVHRPSSAISFGAALYGMSLEKRQIAQFHAQTDYGLLVEDPERLEGCFKVMVGKDATLQAESEPLTFETGDGTKSFAIARCVGKDGYAEASQITRRSYIHFHHLPQNERATMKLIVSPSFDISIMVSCQDGTTQTVRVGEYK